MRIKLFLSFLLTVFLISGICDNTAALELRSAAFKGGGFMPADYTCNGPDVSPPLEWEDVPEDAASFALICYDPDAPSGPWVHWVIYDIPDAATRLPEGVEKREILDDGSKQGVNDFGKIGYNGPCPPPGRAPHKYVFNLYALNAKLDLGPGLSRWDVRRAMNGHIIGEAKLIVEFKR